MQGLVHIDVKLTDAEGKVRAWHKVATTPAGARKVEDAINEAARMAAKLTKELK